jgi:hypothetical protein
LNLLFTLFKLKTTGHGGEVYKGLWRKGEGSFILSRGWAVHAKVIFKREIRVFRYITCQVGKWRAFVTNDSTWHAQTLIYEP